MIDSHVHTGRFSKDAHIQIDELTMVLKDRKVCLCEHMDFGAYVQADKKFDVEEYFDTYHQFHEHVFLGIEIGMDPLYQEIKEYDHMPFDYILGSVHGIRGKNLYHDPTVYPEDKDLFYRNYFAYVIECLEAFPFVDAFAHFDYVSRYTPYEDPLLSYATFQDEYQAMFAVMLNKNVLLEVNTKHILNWENLKKVLLGYVQAGGRYVTLGSDAHEIQGIFKDFDKVSALITQCGLQIVYFDHRVMKNGER